MKLRQLLPILTIVSIFSCQQFDHSEILEQLREHEERILKLEAVCNKLTINNLSNMPAVFAQQAYCVKYYQSTH